MPVRHGASSWTKTKAGDMHQMFPIEHVATSSFRFSRVWIVGSALMLMLSGTGCAKFQYSVVEPSNLAHTIGKQPIHLTCEPLEYQLADLDDRLGIQITNPTDKAVTLSNTKSYLIDPHGTSRPLTGGTIGPRSHVDISLPPSPTILRPGPSSSFGMGLGFGHYPYRSYHRRSPFGLGFGFGYDYPFYDPFYEPPARSYRVLTPEHWEWGMGEVRLHLNYERPEEAFEHDFTFRRTRVQ
jgi:hypothetical protein